MMILLLMGRLLPFPQALLLPLPKPLLLTPRLRLPSLARQAKPRPGRTRWIGRRPTGHRTGRDPPLRMGFLVGRLPRNPMGRCAAQLAICSLCKNAGKTRNGALRVLYAARIGSCRPCPLRQQCQESGTTLKPRRVSAVFWPRTAPAADAPPGGAAPVAAVERTSPLAEEAPASPPAPVQPVRWGDWPRCQIRQEWVQLLRTQTVLISFRATETLVHAQQHSPPLETRAERAHWRLGWRATARSQCSPSHRSIGGNCSSWASCSVHSGVRLPPPARRLIPRFSSFACSSPGPFLFASSFTSMLLSLSSNCLFYSLAPGSIGGCLSLWKGPIGYTRCVSRGPVIVLDDRRK